MSLLLAAAFDTDNCDLEIYRHLADEYHRACGLRPYDNHCLIALQIGARVFNVPVPDLQQPKRGLPHICDTRQKLMAFARLVDERSNSYKSIGRAFKRNHATVIHATHKHRDVIAMALQA
jgi:chromosomal replication initiation ATPase DnaA